MTVKIGPSVPLFGGGELDRQRVQALTDVAFSGGVSELPESLVYYIRALEARLLAEVHSRSVAFAASCWTFGATTP